jgi:hypothetical protein
MASKKNKVAATVTPAPAAKPTPPPKPVVQIDKAIAAMSFDSLQAQVEARREQEVTSIKTQIEKLDETRDGLAKRLADLTGTLAKRRKSGGGTGSRGPRAVNSKPLAEYLTEVLKGHGSPVNAKEAEALLRAKTDWKTNSKNAYMSIFTCLSKNGELFTKTGRGQFTAK